MDKWVKKNMSFRVVIQLVECYIWDVVVAGSNPVYPTIICPHSSTVEQLTCNEQVVGSNPTGGSKLYWTNS